MEKLEVEVNDKGEIGTLPEPLQKFFDRQIGDAVRRKAEALEKEFKPKLADPAQLERLKAIEEENSRLKEAEARALKNYEEADRIKEERYKKQLEEKDGTLEATKQEIARRDERLRSMLGSEVRAAAAAAGARDESLPELVKLLGADLDLDPQTLEPFVKGADGKPKTDKDGKPVTIEGFVTQYLADHPHHLNGGRGKHGKAGGGATLRGGHQGGEADEAKAALTQNPNLTNLTRAVSAVRKRQS